MSELSKLLNIGKVVEEQLNQVGITTAEELAKTGAEERILMQFPLQTQMAIIVKLLLILFGIFSA